MTKQLFSDLTEAASEKFWGGATFQTARVSAEEVTGNGDSVFDPGETWEFSWDGTWNTPKGNKGKDNSGSQDVSNGSSNNLYSFGSSPASITYWIDDPNAEGGEASFSIASNGSYQYTFENV